MRTLIFLPLLAACSSPPPYRTFSGNAFEPSAAAWDPTTERLLVLSDKDQTLFRYAIVDGMLVLPEGEYHAPIVLPGGAAARKFEGMTRLPDGRFLAVTYFGRPDPTHRRLVRFAFVKTGSIEAGIVPVDEDALGRAVGTPWFAIEGLAADATHVYFGVRQTGPNFAGRRDVVLVVRCPFDGAKVSAPDAVLRFDAPDQGLSSLERDPADGALWILTSREEIGRHSGWLYRVPAGRTGLGAPVREFRAKPEALVLLPTGAILVLFDDDRDFKKRFSGYEQSDGLFEILEIRR